MKVTSQTRSPTCVTPTFWPAKTWAEIHLAPFETNSAALGAVGGEDVLVGNEPSLALGVRAGVVDLTCDGFLLVGDAGLFGGLAGVWHAPTLAAIITKNATAPGVLSNE